VVFFSSNHLSPIPAGVLLLVFGFTIAVLTPFRLWAGFFISFWAGLALVSVHIYLTFAGLIAALILLLFALAKETDQLRPFLEQLLM